MMKQVKHDPLYCCEEVRGAGGWHWHQCSRKRVVKRKSKWYCKQHDPVEVELRRTKSQLKYRIQSKKTGLLYKYAAIGREAYRLFKRHGQFGHVPLSKEIGEVEKTLDEIKETEQLLKEMES